jgi:predicted deacylase
MTQLEALIPEALPAGRVSKLQVELGHDGLGRPLRVPVLAARGERPGPVFGITAAVHGNELNGVPVIQQLFRKLDPTALRGTLIACVVVNIPGYLANERQFLGAWDLNHAFPGRPRGNSVQVYAHRFTERIVRHFDVLVDLHTASFGRVNSLYVRADMTQELTARMAYLQRPQIIVHNPPNDRTLRGRAEQLGIPAITVEIGNPQRYHGDFIKRTLQGLRSVLADQHMVRQRRLTPGPEPVLCRRSDWLFTQAGGLLEVFPQVTERVTKGQRIAELLDPWGDLIAEHHAPGDGVVIGKSVNPVAPTGARVLHLGRIAEPDDPRFIRRTA